MTGGAAPEWLTGLWYMALPSRDVRRGKLLRKMLFGAPIVFGRSPSGALFALRDVCPHRAAPLSAGRLIEEDEPLVECPYHGWRFRTNGSCASVPALSQNDNREFSRVKAQAYQLHEANGVIWINNGTNGRAGPAAPDFGLPKAFRPRIIVRELATGPYDEAVIGLVDPAHTPFVHKQWWWRQGKALEEKEKHFEPTALGFKMPAHRPSSNSRIYKMLGGAPMTEIEFRLPGVRIETIRVGKRAIISLTAITPTEYGAADINHILFWDLPLLTCLQPIAESMTRNFLAQDGAILRAQNENLSRERHTPLYLGEPDEPAKWYLRLKRAWAETATGAPFVNPIEGGILRWRT